MKLEISDEKWNQLLSDWATIKSYVTQTSNQSLSSAITVLDETLFSPSTSTTKNQVSLRTMSDILAEIDEDVKTQSNETESFNGDNLQLSDEYKGFVSKPVCNMHYIIL